MCRKWLYLFFAASMALSGPARAEWQEARSTHFTVYANEKPERIRAYTEQLERFDKALRVLFKIPDTGAVSATHVTIYTLDSLGDVQRLYGRKGGDVAGFYGSRISGSVAFVPHEQGGAEKWELSARQILFHEYAHHFMYSSWPDFVFPGWLSEGFAEFCAAADFEKDGSVLFGRPPLYRAFSIIDKTIDLKKVMTADLTTKVGDESVYAKGWLLTHYFILDDRGRALFNDYLIKLQQGVPPDQALKALGTIPELSRALSAHIAKSRRALLVSADRIDVGPVTVTPLTPGGAALMPVRIRSARGVDKDQAQEVVAMAEKLAAPFPADADAQNALAEARYDAGRFEGAAEAAARAAAADPKSVHALLYQGLAALAIAARDQASDPAVWKAARRPIVAANRLDPTSAWALLEYYASFVRAGDAPTKNANDGLITAYRLAPFDNALRFMAARAMLSGDGDKAEARAALAPLVARPHAGELGGVAAAAIAAIDSGDRDAAVAALTGGLAKADAAGE